jgi:phage shock protein PspC (stress-responsive transcriptional regulator)
MMRTMEPEDGSSTTTTAPPPSGRRLTRSTNDRVLAGVAGGLSEYFGVDAVLFRIGFVALTIAGGSGLALYFLAWLLIPEVDDGTAAGLPRLNKLFHRKPILAVIGVIVAINLVANGFWWGDHRPGHDAFWGVVLVAMGVAYLTTRDRPRSTPQDGDGPPLGPHSPPEPDYSIWPPVVPVAAAPRPPRPRAFLTPVTISLLLVAAGIAVLVGASLQGFLALSLLAVGAAMVIGARFGRARGLIPVGLLLAALATAASFTDVSLEGGAGQRLRHPLTVGAVHPYRLGAGELTVDLTDLQLTEGKTVVVDARVGLGQLTVLVPDNVQVRAKTHVGIGQVDVLGKHGEGTSVDETTTLRPSVETGKRLELDLNAGIGEITVEAQHAAA